MRNPSSLFSTVVNFINAVEIGKTYHRHVLSPGDDLANEDAKVVAIAQAAWTQEVLAAYQASLEAA